MGEARKRLINSWETILPGGVSGLRERAEVCRHVLPYAGQAGFLDVFTRESAGAAAPHATPHGPGGCTHAHLHICSSRVSETFSTCAVVETVFLI